MAGTEFSLRIHVVEASGLPRSGGSILGSLLPGGNETYVQIKVDGEKCGKSENSSSAQWHFRTELKVRGDAQWLVIEVKRAGRLTGNHYVAGTSLKISDITRLERQNLPLFDAGKSQAGEICISIERQDSFCSAAAMPRGLTNRAATGGFADGVPEHSEMTTGTMPSGLPAQLHSSGGTAAGAGGGGGMSIVGGPRQSAPGGLVNYAGGGGAASSSAALPAYSASAPTPSYRSPPSASGGLVNYADPGSPHSGGHSADAAFFAPHGATLLRHGTTGLANLAAVGDDGKRVNALPRVRELLEGLEEVGEDTDDFRQRFAQALEELRHVPEADLRSGAGQAAFNTCARRIEGYFDRAQANHDERGTQGALWMAGRLPSSEEDGGQTLQARLRGKWDGGSMEDAIAKASASIPNATRDPQALEELMDALDLAEFHAALSGKDSQSRIDGILGQLRRPLSQHLESLLRSRQLEDVEKALGCVGRVRLDQLGLLPIQQELQRLRGLELLRNALQPLPSQVDFGTLKNRQLRHAMMVVQTAMSDDPSKQTAVAVKELLLKEMLPVCMAHSDDTAVATLDACFGLHISADEIWNAARGPYNSLHEKRKATLPVKLNDKCREWHTTAPDWLLTREQAAAQQQIREALRREDADRLQAACKQVMETRGGSEVCQQELKQAIEWLQKHFRLPTGWSVEKMIGGQGETKLLHKVELTDKSILKAFDQLLKSTAQPSVRTRDRKGAVPTSFTAVRAIEVRNALGWKTYAARRDEVIKDCRKIGTRHDEAHWRGNLNGLPLTQQYANEIARLIKAEPLQREANEVYMIHGTSHTAAESISSADFDMARASPHGLFGAGLYFAESVSKSDEYVQGKSAHGVETFPLLICRVCLGYIYYCDERAPDRRQLEAKCLRGDYHSVLGDRKKTSGTFREFIIYDNLQAFPAYIVYYTRQF